MKVPLEWLKNYVTIKLASRALAERLTMAGLEVIGIHDIDGQPVFDIEVTPNRSDCLSIIGIAREVAAITGQRLKLPLGQGAVGKRQGNRKTKSLPCPTPHAPCPSIHIEDRKGCSRYIGRLIEGVKVGPSPEWMQRRLIACGARPINNLVDITNYVLFEYGQPLHAFDATRLADQTIVIRRAIANEPITTLDGVSRKLTPEVLVIADAKRPVAIAGIMGGVGSEVTQATTDVLLESACFDPVLIRRTGRMLGLSSESSYRFERGIDPISVETASARAAALICELSGGREVALKDVGTQPAARPVIQLDATRASRWLGLPLDPSTIRTTLARLGCRVASTDARGVVHVTPPSFRQDLRRDVDLYEELARMVGYDRIPATLPQMAMIESQTERSTSYWRIESLRCLCASLGFTEAVTWSLISEPALTQCRMAPTSAARLANPLSQDHALLRPSLLMGLLQSVRHNLTQGASGVRLFEVGSVVNNGKEQLRLGLILSGVWSRDWRAKAPGDFFHLKGVMESLIHRLCTGALHLKPAGVPWSEPQQAAEVRLGERSVGVAGQVALAITQALDIEQGVWFAELIVEELLTARRPAPIVRAPAMLPPVKRDLSVLVGEEVPFASLDRVIHEVAGTLASRIELIDRYTGKSIPQGKVSLTFSIEYRDPARTLTATEVDGLHQRITQALAAQFHAQLR